jgi:hypothetical protein
MVRRQMEQERQGASHNTETRRCISYGQSYPIGGGDSRLCQQPRCCF